MNRYFSIRHVSATLAALTILTFNCLALAGDDRPLKGHADAVVTSAVPEADGLHLTLSATGNATHLGKFTREENVVIHADGSISGTLVFIAANGDQLNADVDGGFISPTTAVGTYTFTGGTGRFANAAGTASFTGVTTDGIHLAVEFAGSITY